MTQAPQARCRERKTYRVGYYIEQCFFIDLEARSPEQAEFIVRRRLDATGDGLTGSVRTNYQDDIVCIDEVRS